jgi:hypothetical protein
MRMLAIALLGLAACGGSGSDAPPVEFTQGVYLYEGEVESTCPGVVSGAVSCEGGLQIDSEGRLLAFALSYGIVEGNEVRSMTRESLPEIANTDDEIVFGKSEEGGSTDCGADYLRSKSIEVKSTETGRFDSLDELSLVNTASCPPDEMRIDCATTVTATYVLEMECLAPCRLAEPMMADPTKCGLTECMCP